jgi:hypothetical protein
MRGNECFKGGWQRRQRALRIGEVLSVYIRRSWLASVGLAGVTQARKQDCRARRIRSIVF